MNNFKETILYKIKKIIRYIEQAPTNFFLWVATFLSIIFIRLLTETALFHFKNQPNSFLFYEFTHTFLFFLFSFLIFLLLLKILLKSKISHLSNLLTFGFLVIILPPIIDFLISNGKGYWSFYKFDGITGLFKRFFTFFGDNPEIGITYGVRIEVAIILFLLVILAYTKTKTLRKTVTYSFIFYLTFFALGTFPSYITIIGKGFQKGFFNVTDLDIAKMFLSPAYIFSSPSSDIKSALNIKMSLVYPILILTIILWGLFLNYRSKLISFLKNIRPTQIIYHLGLLLLGTGLGIKITNPLWSFDFFNIVAYLNIMLAVVLSWTTSAIINDIADEKIDAISNKNRPLILGVFSKKEYVAIGVITFFFSLLLSAIVNPKVTMLLIAYQAMAWIYSVYPLRFKRIPLLATILSSIASILIFVAGYILVAPSQDISQLPTRILWLLFLSLTLSLPIKDLKDIEGDKKEGIKTIPVIFGEHTGKLIIGSGIFISYILSVIFLNEKKLLWWAILLGGISFWLINISENKKINNRNIINWIIALLFVFLIIAYLIIF